MASPARGDRAWSLLAALAILALGCAAARDLLQNDVNDVLENVDFFGPFDASMPTDCADLCMEQEDCRGYRWRGGMCNLTVEAGTALSMELSTRMETPPSNDTPSGMETPVKTVPALAPGVAPASDGDMDMDMDDTPGQNDTVPMTMEEIIAFIEECRGTGSIAALAAASAACLVVTNDCPVPPEDPSDNVAPLNLAGNEPPLPAVEQLRAALDEACRRETIETCKRESFTLAELLAPDCFRILNRGPAVSVVGCEDTRVANTIFANETDKICEA